MDDGAWQRIEDELERREKGLQWLADQLEFTVQRVQNWKSRGLPPSAYADVARVLGRTVDWVAGLEPRGVAREPGATYDASDESTATVITLFPELPKTDREELAAEVRRRVDKYRAYLEERGVSPVSPKQGVTTPQPGAQSAHGVARARQGPHDRLKEELEAGAAAKRGQHGGKRKRGGSGASN